MSDHYQTLGVPRTATREEIGAAFKRLSYLHPDKHPDDPGAVARYAQVTEAYAELSDPLKRARYDAAPSGVASGSRSELLRELVVEEFTGIVELAGEIGSTAQGIDPAMAGARILGKATSAEGRQQIRALWGALRSVLG